jgi:UDP-N-acetylglucosamine:LPS N-acetylglucosamine transferase
MNQELSENKILFFSRGRGRGHAIPDMAIAEEIQRLKPEWKIVFASYGTGAETFRLKQRPVMDMSLPDNNMYLDTLFRAVELIEEIRPTAVIAHEEFAALTAARLLGTPTIFISAWLPVPNFGISTESLAYANRAIILESPGIFPVPPQLSVKPVYTGPMARKMVYGRADRAKARAELGLTESMQVISVLGSGGLPESRAPLADLVLAAFHNLTGLKFLNWIAGSDSKALQLRVAGRTDVLVYPFFDPIEKILAASDVVITKGTRGATLDCVAVGVPSISISFGTNPIDDLLVPRVRSNTSLYAKAMDSTILLSQIQKVLACPPVIDASELVEVEHVARVLIEELTTLS